MKLLTRAARAGRWLQRHPREIVIGSVGFVAGVLAAAPLGWTLLPQNADFIGAMAGAFIPVFGALWVLRVQTEDERKEFGAAIVAVLQPVLNAANNANVAYEKPVGSHPDVHAIRKGRLNFLASEVADCMALLDRHEIPLAMVGYVGNARLMAVERALRLYANAHVEHITSLQGSEVLAAHLNGYADMMMPLDAVASTVADAINHFAKE